MKKTDHLKDIAAKLCASLPSHLKNVKKDVEKNFQAVLKSAFSKLDLVTREEFDAQTKVLARTRQKIEALAAEMHAHEKKRSGKKHDE